MNPHPESILDPLKFRAWVASLLLRQGPTEASIALPKNNGIVDSRRGVLNSQKFKIDMKERRAVKTDQQSGLAHVLAGKARQ
jgi:hypothetical protein